MAIALFSLQKPNDRSHGMLGRNRYAHVHVVRHQVSFHNVALFLLG